MVRVEPLTLAWIERNRFVVVDTIDDPDEGAVWRWQLPLEPNT